MTDNSHQTPTNKPFLTEFALWKLVHEAQLWESFVEDEDPQKINPGLGNSYLCSVYLDKDRDSCGECPVARCFDNFCAGTARDDAFFAHQRWLAAEEDSTEACAARDEFREHARRMIAQLEEVKNGPARTS